jgi:CSLREA domain-containing protein
MTALRYALVLALVLLPTGPFATTFPVTKTADTNDGTCDPDCSLREAIDAANTNPGADDVPVPAGTYLLTLGQLTVSDDVSIAGAGQTNTIIDGNASDRVFEIEAIAGVVEISGVTIQNGNAYSQGGGIRNYADLSLTDSTVSGNTAYTHGGGIYAGPYVDLTITNSTVSGNVAFYNGGGVRDDHYGFATLTNSTVSGNTSGWGGGGIWGDYFSLTNSTVSDNTASEDGGGINGSNFSMTNSTVNGNTADYRGGGIWGGRFTLANSTVSGNTAYLVGGLLASSATITNSTVSGNTSSGFGDGIYAVASTLANTIVADNGEINCSNNPFGGISSLGNNLSDDETCGLTDPSDLVVADAMLGPLQDNGGPTETHDLLPGSPAIDAGSVDCPPPATDQRGVARPQGSACDIGAVEYLPEPHHATTLIVGAAFLGLLCRRRTRALRIG